MIARRKWQLVGLAALAVCGGAVLRAYSPEEYSFYPSCPFFSVFGWHCAGCGTTRAVHALLQGDVQQAAAYNVAFALALPILFPVTVVGAFCWLRGKAPPLRTMPVWLVWTLIVVLLLFTVLRNLPYPPFDSLAPHRLW
jgi:hypothetical protein